MNDLYGNFTRGSIMKTKPKRAWLSGIVGIFIGTSVLAAIPQSSGVATHNMKQTLYAEWPVILHHELEQTESESRMQRLVIRAAQEEFLLHASVN